MRARTGKSTNDGRQMMKILGNVIEDAITLTRKLDTNANVKAIFEKGRTTRATDPHTSSFFENENSKDLIAAVTTRYGWEFEPQGANGGSVKTYSTPFGTIKVKIYWRSLVWDNGVEYSNSRQTTYDPMIMIKTKWHNIKLDRQYPLKAGSYFHGKWLYKHSSPSDKFYYSIENRKINSIKNRKINRTLNRQFGFESDKIELGFLKAVLAKNSDVVALSNYLMDGKHVNFSAPGLPIESVYYRRPRGQ
jgi:hypothetical protein